MAHIKIKKAFTMPLEEVHCGLEKIAKSLEKNQGMSYGWVSDDKVEFSHKAGKGSIAIEQDQVVMHLKIGLLYSAMAPIVKKKVQEYADKYIY